MNRLVKIVLQLILAGALLIISATPGFAAAVRRVPNYDAVEQGLMDLILDAEGAANFRYTGQENKMHVYRGTIKPGSKVKLVLRATLLEQKKLPITGRTCTTRFQAVAKKGSEVVKKQSFKSDNKSNVFVNYTVPQNADMVEIIETFVLKNKSTNKKFNQTTTSRNKLLLTTPEAEAAVGVSKKPDGGNKEPDGSNGDKKTAGNDAGKKSGADNGMTKTDGDSKESQGSGTGMLAGAVAAVAAIGGGTYFFMKKRKETRAANEETARKEKLRQQAIMRQQELQREQARREEEQLRLMQQQTDAGQQQTGTAGACVSGAAGAMGSIQNKPTENESQDPPDDTPRFCSNCGAPLKPGSRFCENCGAKV